MTGAHRLPAGLLGLVLVSAVAVAALVGRPDRAPVYSVAAVRAGLSRDPGPWLGRILRVRGVAEPCEFSVGPSTVAGPRSACLYGWPVLRSDTPAEAGGVLLLGRGQPDPLFRPLRDIPLLRSLVPAPSAFRWGVAATYTVEIVALPDAMPGTLHDYQALLLDAEP